MSAQIEINTFNPVLLGYANPDKPITPLPQLADDGVSLAVDERSEVTELDIERYAPFLPDELRTVIDTLPPSSYARQAGDKGIVLTVMDVEQRVRYPFTRIPNDFYANAEKPPHTLNSI